MRERERREREGDKETESALHAYNGKIDGEFLK